MSNPSLSLRRRPFAAALLCLLLFPVLAWAGSHQGKTVTVIRKGGRRPLTGKVLEDNPDELVLELPYGKTAVNKADIERVIDAESNLLEHKKRYASCKTGEDFYQLALWARKIALGDKFVREDMEAAVKADSNHEKARNYLGYKKTPNGRGGWDWVYRREKGDRDSISKTIKAKKDAIAERPWEETELILKYPESNPVYEIHTNCPETVGRGYGEFMVKLRTGLMRLAQSVCKKPIRWRDLGLGKLYICNSQKTFMEITGSEAGVGGFYTPSYFPAADAERVIVAFHGTFGMSGDTFKVLAHEGTHQLQGRMWEGQFQTRPPWLIEGLAVYFGDGHYIDKGGAMRIGIPRDRLNNMRRGFASKRYIPLKSLFYTPYQKFSAFHYAHGWAVIYWMLHSGESFTYKGKTFKLRELFGRFFEKNLASGFQHMTQMMGAQNREEVLQVCDQMEVPWKRYIKSLAPPSVGKIDKKNKNLFVSEGIGFQIEKPRNRRKINWSWVPETNLFEGELVGVDDKESSARFAIGQRANQEIIMDVDKLAGELIPFLRFKYGSFKRLPDEKLTLKGQPIFVLNFTGRENKNQLNDNPYPKEVRLRYLIYLAGENYFLLMCQTDADKWEESKEKFDPLISGFKLIVKR